MEYNKIVNLKLHAEYLFKTILCTAYYKIYIDTYFTKILKMKLTNLIDFDMYRLNTGFIYINSRI